MQIGQKIKKIRELKNLTQEHLANELGMTQSAYSKIENNVGDLTLSRLDQIGKALNVAVEEIIGFNDSIVFNMKNNKKANGLIINQMSVNERKVYDNYIESLKAEISSLRGVVTKLLDKPTKK